MIKLQSDIVLVNGAVLSQIGGRPENQDDFDFVDTPLGFLLIICDGMGGGPGGKTASYIVKYEIASSLGECSTQTRHEQALKAAVARANEVLEEKMEEIPSLKGMGSTFVAILINKYSAFVAHAGDSRCYQIRNGKCIYRSNDHSLVSELVKSKALTEEEARKSPQSNIISRGLGSVGNNVPEIEEIPYRKGDRFVLCTDGVWGSMPNKDLVSRFSQKSDLESLVSNISAEIDNIGFSKGGGHDNHTLAIFDMGQDSILKEKAEWKRLSVLCLLSCAGIAVAVCAVIFFIKHNPFVSDSIHTETKKSAITLPGTERAKADYAKININVDSAANLNIESDSISKSGNQQIDSLKTGRQEENPGSDEQKRVADSVVDIDNLTPKQIIGITIEDFQNLQNLSCEEDKETALNARNELWNKISRDLDLLMQRLESGAVKDEMEKFTMKFKRKKEGEYPIDAKNCETHKFHLTNTAKKVIDKNIQFLKEINEQLTD